MRDGRREAMARYKTTGQSTSRTILKKSIIVNIIPHEAVGLAGKRTKFPTCRGYLFVTGKGGQVR